jgi:hypothetical protein
MWLSSHKWFLCVKDRNGNPFLRHEKKIVMDSLTPKNFNVERNLQ